MPEHKTYAVFSCLWALATLFHLVAQPQWPAPLLHVLLAGAALFVLQRPSASGRLLVLAVVQVCESWTTAPEISNHWLFTGLVNLTILQAYVRLVWIRRTLAVAGTELYRSFAPVVRLELIILYFFVVFHKLNTDFLAPQTSCAGHFYLAQVQRLPLLEAFSLSGAIPVFLTLAIEAAIPVLLCLRATRNAGIFLGLSFHAVLSFNPISGFYNFSSMLFALFFLFASFHLKEGPTVWIADRMPSWQGLSFARQGLLAAGAVGLVWLLLAGLNDFFAAPGDLILPAWGLYCAGLIALFLWLPKSAPAEGLFTPLPRALLLVPVLTVFNGCSPYLGLKTETAFAMYSNLRTEGGRSNHLLVPASVQVFDFQRDLVEIKDSSSGFLSTLAQRRLLLPFFEVRAFLEQRPNTRLTYQRHAPAGAPADEQLRQPVPWPLRKLLYFRPVASDGPQPCSH